MMPQALAVPLPHTRTAARLLAQGGQRDEAAALLAEALERYEQAGGGVAAGAEGLTNGAVARRLYILPHIVNTRLRHVFAKLGVPNRVGYVLFPARGSSARRAAVHT